MNTQKQTWGFYPGNHDTAGEFGYTDVFIKKNLVGIGWPLTGTLQTFIVEQRSLADIEVRIREAYQYLPDIKTWDGSKKDRWMSRSAGIMYRFLMEALPGDTVIYASKIDEYIHVGQFLDSENKGYFYDDDGGNSRFHMHFRHFRAVKWTHSIDFKECTKQELAIVRTQNTFWRMKECPDKFLYPK